MINYVKKHPLYVILIVVFAAIFIFSAVNLIMIQLRYSEGDELYTQAQTRYVEKDAEDSELKEFATITPEPEESRFPDLGIDFGALRETNSDIIGWIWIPDTIISYPMLMSSDNNDYLRTGYDKNYNYYGSIFVDYRNSPELIDTNTIIYGHNMQNEAMFGMLSKFSDTAFANAHKYVYVFTENSTLQYRIYSAYTTDIESDTYKLGFADDDEKQSFLNYTVSCSDITPDDAPEMNNTQSKVITLSTCLQSGSSPYRFVVHAVFETEIEK